MCPDLEIALADLGAKGVTISHPVRDLSWGRWATIKLPSGADLSLYQPRHPTAYHVSECANKITNLERERARPITRRLLDFGSRINSRPCLSRCYPSASVPIALAEDVRACRIVPAPTRSSLWNAPAASGKPWIRPNCVPMRQRMIGSKSGWKRASSSSYGTLERLVSKWRPQVRFPAGVHG